MRLAAKPHPNRVCLDWAEYTSPSLRHSLAFTFGDQQSMKAWEMPKIAGSTKRLASQSHGVLVQAHRCFLPGAGRVTSVIGCSHVSESPASL